MALAAAMDEQVRLALGLPTHPQLRAAGDRLAQLLATDPDEADVTE